MPTQPFMSDTESKGILAGDSRVDEPSSLSEGGQVDGRAIDPPEASVSEEALPDTELRPLHERILLLSKVGDALLQRMYDVATQTRSRFVKNIPKEYLDSFNQVVAAFNTDIDPDSIPGIDSFRDQLPLITALTRSILQVLSEASEYQKQVCMTLASLNSLGFRPQRLADSWQICAVVLSAVNTSARVAFLLDEFVQDSPLLYVGMTVLNKSGELGRKSQSHVKELRSPSPLESLRRRAGVFAALLVDILTMVTDHYGPDLLQGWPSELSPTLHPFWVLGFVERSPVTMESPDEDFVSTTRENGGTKISQNHSATPMPIEPPAAATLDASLLWLTRYSPVILQSFLLAPLIVSPNNIPVRLLEIMTEAIEITPQTPLAGSHFTSLPEVYSDFISKNKTIPEDKIHLYTRAAQVLQSVSRQRRGEVLSRRAVALVRAIQAWVARPELVPSGAPLIMSLLVMSQHLVADAFVQPANVSVAALRDLCAAVNQARQSIFDHRLQIVSLWEQWILKLSSLAATGSLGLSQYGHDLILRCATPVYRHRAYSLLLQAQIYKSCTAALPPPDFSTDAVLSALPPVGAFELRLPTSVITAASAVYAATECATSYSLVTGSAAEPAFIDAMRPHAGSKTDLPTSDIATLIYLSSSVATLDKSSAFRLLSDDSASRLVKASTTFVQKVFRAMRDEVFRCAHVILCAVAADQVQICLRSVDSTVKDRTITRVEKKAARGHRKRVQAALAAVKAQDETGFAGAQTHKEGIWASVPADSVRKASNELRRIVEAIGNVPKETPLGNLSVNPGLVFSLSVTAAVTSVLKRSVPDSVTDLLPPSIFRAVIEAVVNATVSLEAQIRPQADTATLRSSFLPDRVLNEIAHRFAEAVLPPPRPLNQTNAHQATAELLAPTEISILNDFLGSSGSAVFLEHTATHCLKPAVAVLFECALQYGLRIRQLGPRMLIPGDVPQDLFMTIQPALQAFGHVVQVSCTILRTNDVTDFPLMLRAVREAIPQELIDAIIGEDKERQKWADTIIGTLPAICAAIFRQIPDKKGTHRLFSPTGAAAAAIGVAPFFNIVEKLTGLPHDQLLYRYSKIGSALLATQLQAVGRKIPYGPDILPPLQTLGEDTQTIINEMAVDIDQNTLDTLVQVCFFSDAIGSSSVGCGCVSLAMIRTARRVLTNLQRENTKEK